MWSFEFYILCNNSAFKDNYCKRSTLNGLLIIEMVCCNVVLGNVLLCRTNVYEQTANVLQCISIPLYSLTPMLKAVLLTHLNNDLSLNTIADGSYIHIVVVLVLHRYCTHLFLNLYLHFKQRCICFKWVATKYETKQWHRNIFHTSWHLEYVDLFCWIFHRILSHRVNAMLCLCNVCVALFWFLCALR